MNLFALSLMTWWHVSPGSTNYLGQIFLSSAPPPDSGFHLTVIHSLPHTSAEASSHTPSAAGVTSGRQSPWAPASFKVSVDSLVCGSWPASSWLGLPLRSWRVWQATLHRLPVLARSPHASEIWSVCPDHQGSLSSFLNDLSRLCVTAFPWYASPTLGLRRSGGWSVWMTFWSVGFLSYFYFLLWGLHIL